jgi:hypothetical protein
LFCRLYCQLCEKGFRKKSKLRKHFAGKLLSLSHEFSSALEDQRSVLDSDTNPHGSAFFLVGWIRIRIKEGKTTHKSADSSAGCSLLRVEVFSLALLRPRDKEIAIFDLKRIFLLLTKYFSIFVIKTLDPDPDLDQGSISASGSALTKKCWIRIHIETIAGSTTLYQSQNKITPQLLILLFCYTGTWYRKLLKYGITHGEITM